MKQKLFFVIEGGDGSGKTTQVQSLKQCLTEAGFSVHGVKLPRYDNPSSYFISRYLAGDYGSLDEVNPYQASVLYAVERFDLKTELAATDADIIISDRFVGSNLAHQGCKIADAAARRQFFRWVIDLEFEKLKVPRPTLNLVLLVDAAKSRDLNQAQSEIEATKLDIHDLDLDHQTKARLIYRQICSDYPDEFVAIECQTETGDLKTPAAVAELIMAQIKPHLKAI